MLLVLAAPTFAAALALTGCASDGGGARSASAGGPAMSTAMMCPKCETVWAREKVGSNFRVQRYSSGRQMTCPNCDTTAQKHVMDGHAMMHDCPECMVAMVPVTPSQGPERVGPRP